MHGDTITALLQNVWLFTCSGRCDVCKDSDQLKTDGNMLGVGAISALKRTIMQDAFYAYVYMKD